MGEPYIHAKVYNMNSAAPNGLCDPPQMEYVHLTSASNEVTCPLCRFAISLGMWGPREPDTKMLSENVDGHAMGPYTHHEFDDRMCGYHHRLGKWVTDSDFGKIECTRDHPKHLRGM